MRNRAVRATRMNEASSRSHAVLQVCGAAGSVVARPRQRC